MPSLKENIIHEALRLFSLKGFSSTSITDILEAAGVSKGGFYNHFRSKEDLFYAVLERARQIWREKVLEGVDQVDDPIGKICLVLKNYRDSYLIDFENIPGGCIFITLAVELADQHPKLADAVNQGFSGFKAMITGYLNQAQKTGDLRSTVSARAIAEMVFAGMLGASVMYGINKSADDLNYAIEAVIQYLKELVRV